MDIKEQGGVEEGKLVGVCCMTREHFNKNLKKKE